MHLVITLVDHVFDYVSHFPRVAKDAILLDLAAVFDLSVVVCLDLGLPALLVLQCLVALVDNCVNFVVEAFFSPRRYLQDIRSPPHIRIDGGIWSG